MGATLLYIRSALAFQHLLIYNRSMTTQQDNVTLDDGDAGSVGRPPGEKVLPGPATHPDHQESGSLLRRNRDLAALYAIPGQLNRKIDWHEALQEVLPQVPKILGLHTAQVSLLN